MNDILYGRLIPWPLGEKWDVYFSDFIYSYFSAIKYTSITLAGLAIVLTFNTHTYIAAYFMGMLAFFLMQVIFFSDYRLTSSLHHIVSFIGIVFYFLPNKRRTLKASIFLILILSAIYQLNASTLSGDSHGYHWVLNLQIPFILGLLFIRISSPFLLYSRNRFLRYLGGIALMGTLIVEYLTVSTGPLVTALLLFILFLYFDQQEKKRIDHRYTSYILPEPHPGWPYFVSIGYIGLQFSFLLMPIQWPDPIRYFFTLHKQPRVQNCSTAIATYSQNLSQLVKAEITSDPKTRCDIVEVYQLVKDQCENQLAGENSRVQIIHTSQYLSGPFEDRQVNVEINDLNFCEKVKKASFIEVSKWIKAEQSPSKYFW